MGVQKHKGGKEEEQQQQQPLQLVPPSLLWLLQLLRCHRR